MQEVIATFGRLDIVVSNAGMNVFEGAAECSESRWAYNLDLNLASHWRLARIAKPYLEQSGNGVILLMTSNHAFCSIPGCFPYNVTKTAITGLVRSLTIEWGTEDTDSRRSARIYRYGGKRYLVQFVSGCYGRTSTYD